MKKCPKCQSRKRVHRSRRDLSVLVQLMGFHRFRCTDCILYFEGFSPIPSYGRKNGHESESEQEFKSASTHSPDHGLKKQNNQNGDSNRQFCPNCQSTKVRRSKRVGVLETTVYPLTAKFPYRCNEC